MRLTDKQVKRLARLILEELKSQNVVSFKGKEDEALKKAVEVINADLQQERQLEEEVNKMMDDLEKQNPGEFQRYKMFPMLKKKLAKEKGIIL